uniref:Agenet domain-containing protein n=1 Tax=Triticum urartu TaxID=4572 RepID=A0A8R7UJS8_TRIUA
MVKLPLLVWPPRIMLVLPALLPVTKPWIHKEMPPPCSTTPSNSSSVINDKNMEKQKPPPCSAIASTSSTVIDDNKTMEKQKEMPPPCSTTPQSTTIGQIIKSSVVPRSVVNCQTIAHNQPPPSGTSTCNVAANDASTMLNPEKMFQPGCRLEALSQDSSVRGCWFKCVVLSRREKDNKVRVRYQDILNSEGKGQLRESLKVAKIAEPDHLGIRLTKRPMLRPHLPRHYRKIESPVAAGVIVDARLKGGWWEGIVLQQETADHVQVYLQGEGRLVELQVECLRKSFEWHEEQWIPLDARKDVAAKITLDLKGGERSSKQKAQKMDEQSSQTAAAAAAELAAPTAELVQPLEQGDDEPANSAPPRKRFLAQGYSFEEKRLEEHAKKIKGTANEAAKPVAAEGDGMSHGGSSADAKRCWVDPANSDGLNCAEREGKAAKSSGVKKMGSMEGSGSQGGASGGAAPVKPVPREEICVTNAEAPAVAMDKSEVIDLTLDD